MSFSHGITNGACMASWFNSLKQLRASCSLAVLPWGLIYVAPSQLYTSIALMLFPVEPQCWKSGARPLGASNPTCDYVRIVPDVLARKYTWKCLCDRNVSSVLWHIQNPVEMCMTDGELQHKLLFSCTFWPFAFTLAHQTVTVWLTVLPSQQIWSVSRVTNRILSHRCFLGGCLACVNWEQ